MQIEERRAGGQAAVAEDRFERVVLLPAGRVHRLPVVVEIDEQRAFRAGGRPFAEDEWIAVGLEEFGGETAPLERGPQKLRLAPDVCGVGRDRRDGDRLHQLFDERLLRSVHVPLDGGAEILRGRRSGEYPSHGQEGRTGCNPLHWGRSSVQTRSSASSSPNSRRNGRSRSNS